MSKYGRLDKWRLSYFGFRLNLPEKKGTPLKIKHTHTDICIYIYIFLYISYVHCWEGDQHTRPLALPAPSWPSTPDLYRRSEASDTNDLGPKGRGSKQMVPFSGRCTTHFRLF